MAGDTWSEIPESLVEWIKKQHMFWVASAPLSCEGHVNISPKGVAGTFHVENSSRVWYEDLSGSGAETIAHIRENGRVTILFNAFDGPPRIARLYGTGSFFELGTPQYNALLPPGTRQPGSRAVVVVDIYKVATTCGYSVPYYTFVGHRTPLLDWAARKEAIDRASSHTPIRPPPQGSTLVASTGSAAMNANEVDEGPSLSDRIAKPHPNGLLAWWRDRNTLSLDGLPALDMAFRQPPSSLGGHQPVRKAQHSALNQYPPSKQPLDTPTASDIQLEGPWVWHIWLASWVRWFLHVELFSFISVLVSSIILQADSLAKSIPTATTLFTDNAMVEESANEAVEVEGPPVSWGVKHKNLPNTRGLSPPDPDPKLIPEHQLRWSSHRAQARSPSSSPALLGYGASFLLGMIFMMFCGEVQLAAGATHAAALVFGGRKLSAGFSPPG